MKIYKHFDLPDWKFYQQTLLDFYNNSHDYDYQSIADDKNDNFLKILRRGKLQELLPGLVSYFDSIGHPIVFVETIGVPATADLYSEIHRDSSPLFEDYFMASYALNFPLTNTENSKIIFFDEEQREITRLNYDHCPLLFRTDVWHSVVNYSGEIRLTASIRFFENDNLESHL